MLIAEGAPLRTEELNKIDAYWRAANYLSVGQIYLMGNPLLREPLLPEHVKPRLLGHWGTTPGLNLVYAHLNRVIAARRQEMIYVTGPGHGGPGLVANVWLEGTYAEVYPRVSQDVTGMSRLFTQFSFPGGVPSHVAPETPGSIHEGGELGYSLSHAYGAVLDNPDLVAVCVIGDGEAETGPLATSWHSNKFLDPAGDGAVLPILHLNGYKIANPAVLARIGDDELDALLRGYGHEPYLVEGDDPAAVHQSLAATLDAVFDRIAAIQRAAREDGVTDRPQWPVIVLRTPRAGPGPRRWTGCPSRGRGGPTRYPCRQRATTRRTWPRCASGCCPTARTSSSTSPGGRDPRELELPDFRQYGVKAGETAEATRVLGGWLRDVLRANVRYRNFRLVGPDETESNRLGAVLEETDKVWQARIDPVDQHLGPHGRVMEILSEHTCQGWLEGYLLTGRHGLFSCYEAFVHIVDSMFNQHAKWLKVIRKLPWRRPIPSLNYLLTSHVWRQDHNGFSHQDPGFIDHVVNKKADVIRVYLPPDTNTQLSVADHCLRSRN